MDEQKLLKVFSFQIVDKADGKHAVIGIATSEAKDHDGERAQYKGTLDAIKVWSAEFEKTTKNSGQEVSLGNIRVQHDAKQIGGKVTAINPDSEGKAIGIETEPRKTVYEELIETGMVTGFSIAGRYAKQWVDAEGDKWYIPEIVEISYVDSPCNPDAGFTHVKANGIAEFRKFSDLKKTAEAKGSVTSVDVVRKTVREQLIEAGLIKEARTKRVADDELPATCFAYVGETEDPSTWICAYKGFSTEAKNKLHVRKALARFNQTQGIPASERAKVKAKLVAAAKKHGIEISEKSAKAVRAALTQILCEQTDDDGKVRYDRAAAEKMVATADEIFVKVRPETALFKGMYTVGSLAQLMESLAWMVASTEYERDREQDDSPVPDDLRSVLEDLIPVFIDMATEEANELLTQNKTADGGQGGKSMDTTAADLLKAAKDAFADLWKKTKSVFTKIGKGHDGCSKSFGKAAEHHSDMAEHHATAAEACADKTVQDELNKLAAGDDFKKSSKIDQILAKAEVLVEKGSGHAKMFGKMAKCHGGLCKCMEKAAGHHDDLGKAAVDVSNADEAPDTQGRSKEETEAKAAADKAAADKVVADKAAADKVAADALAKGANADVVKMIQDGFAGVNARMGEIEKSVATVKGEVEKQGATLETGPKAGAAAGGNVAMDEKHGKDGKDGKSASMLEPADVKKTSSAAGMFGR